MKNWQQIKAIFLTMFGLKALPQKDGKLNLTEEQAQELKDALGDPKLFDNFQKLANAELALEKDKNETKAQLKALLKEAGIESSSAGEPNAELELETTQASSQSGSKKGDTPKKTPDAEITGMIADLRAKLKEQQEQIQALSEKPEEDAGELIKGTGKMDIRMSDTHLFASGKSYDAFEGRPWNQRLKELANLEPGQKPTLGATDWTDSHNIDRVNQDFQNYWREYRDEIIDVMQDYRGIPSNWEVISGVDDEIGYVGLITQEITQGRKKNWLPKNKQKFVPLTGKVYPVQIDIEFQGYELQKIETSWMNRFNKEGSSPFKTSFMMMLVKELMKQARSEDNQVIVKGVYFPDVDRTEPQNFIFRSNGFLKIVNDQMYKTFLPFKNLGTPTPENIVDYVKSMCELLPEEKRNMPGLDYGMSPTHVRWYIEKKKLLEGTYTNYVEGDMSIDGFPNVQIKKIDYLDGTNFHYITPDDNIKILENLPREKALLRLEYSKRQVFMYGDYKLGTHVDVFGLQWEAGKPVDYNNQIFWCNDVELLTDVKVPIDADVVTPSAEYHNVLVTSANTQATAITDITNAENGKYYYLYGGSDANASTIASGAANFDLTANITLNSKTMIKLYKRPSDGKFTEIYRQTNLKDEPYVILAPNATTADADLGNHFVTSENTQATAITDITNAVEGTVYRLEGGSSTNATTIAKNGKFSRLSAAITLNNGVYVDVLYQGGKFIELTRG